MHFLPDVYITCDECKGTRYNQDTLSILYRGANIEAKNDIGATSLYVASSNNNIKTNDEEQIDMMIRLESKVIELDEAGYTQPIQRTDIKVQGKTGLALFQAGVMGMRYGDYISDHDVKIAQKLSWVMNGGDLSAPTQVSEQYLLDLEREAFLSLCGEPKTLERIQSILFKGKPLRN